jgi:hypothetical protein
VRFANDKVEVNGRTLAFSTVVGEAYLDRKQLWSDGFYATPGLSWDKDKMQGRPFYYYAYGAAVSEVVVDTLTGEWKLLRADILHDAGKSLNPAVDIGQVEGAFIQGMGWLTTEELVWHPHKRQAHHARAQHLQDSDGERLPACIQRAPVRRPELRGLHPPQQGSGRAAAAAAVLGVLRDPRRGFRRGRPRGRSAAEGAGHERVDPSRHHGGAGRSGRMTAGRARTVRAFFTTPGSPNVALYNCSHRQERCEQP